VPSPKPFDLTGRVAVVTGGNGGIGRGIALGLAEAGAGVAILARNEEKNRSTLRDLESFGVAAMAVRVDVADRDALEPALAEVERRLGPVDVLVNNAGIAVVKGALDHTPEEWQRVLDVNLTACFLLSRIAARSMIRRKRGKIVNIASEYSLFGSGFVTSYSAAKGGLVQLTKSMAIELAPMNVQVNAIVPGWIDTDLTAVVKTMPLYQEILTRTPAGRFGRPDECAGAAVFLASSASDFVTGASIFVDGGYSIR
jgi:2-deoxy-D-gluconate 3-dehydrogenase